MKIILTGAQGTGKTTILERFVGKLPVITEVVRNLSKQGVKINELGDEEGQHKIFNTYIELLQSPEYISDRCLTDVYAYSLYHFDQGKLSLDELAFEAGELEKLAAQKDILICYFPIEFGVVDDGVRSTNENYRQFIDTAIRDTLDSFGFNYIVVKGTVEERLRQIEQAAKEFEL